MKSDKVVKKEFKIIASKDPDKYYPTAFLKKNEFERKQCSCGTFFWTVNNEQDHCGDPACTGGFNVVSDNPAKNKLSFIDVWRKIEEVLNPRGYKSINRYPVVARWNPTTDFVIASIAAFQPYVITGEQEPPAKKLIIPQFCLRFGDIDNVGITGAHMTGFVMIGQHMFVDAAEWNQEEVFKDIYDFLIDGVGLAKQEVTIHEDAWAGGGSFGPCMEFFSRGVELFNQVYTLYEQTPDGNKEIELKVLDMGLGMERIAWFSQGTPNIYEATFPYVLNKLREKTKIEMDHELYNKFSLYSSSLNADEVEDIDAEWAKIAEKLKLDVEELKQKVMPMAALYSIAEHSRALLVSINDGMLPSNVGGGYNLRVILRRALSFIDQFSLDIDLADVCRWHAEELKDIFPELSSNLDGIAKLLTAEKERFQNTKQKAAQIVSRLLADNKEISKEKLIELYDSNGITPELIEKEASKLGKEIDVPDNFYALVAEMHEAKENVQEEFIEAELNLEGVEDTEALYYDNYSKSEFEGVVLKIIDDKVILDKTLFYPTSGGQDTDYGEINGCKVVDVFKQNNIIVHVVEGINFKEGDSVEGKIDSVRRKQLAQHHTATHIINAAAQEVLGAHINQAGAKKTIKKAHLDVTHYQSISADEVKKIETKANQIVGKKIKINSIFLPRTEAEEKYSMRIYQGGAVPGKKLRIVDIEGIDVEACGGTHLNNTSEAEAIKIIKTSKIQDGIVRIEFVAGDAAKHFEGKSSDLVDEIAKLLGVSAEQVPARAEELFSKWKTARKATKKGKKLEAKELELSSSESFDGDVLEKTAEVLRTQPEHLQKTISRFLKELDEFKAKLN